MQAKSGGRSDEETIERLVLFRETLYKCASRRVDALFELCDTLCA